MKSKKGQVVNRTQLAEIFGVALHTVNDWTRRGCPYIQKANKGIRNQQWQFNTADVSRWLQEEAVRNAIGQNSKNPGEDPKYRKAMADAALAELELARVKGELLEADAVEKAGITRASACRSRMLAIPSKLGIRVNDETRRLIEVEIHKALHELGNIVLSGEPAAPS